MLETKFTGAGGGKSKSAVRTADNLFSTDTVEAVLALSEGPIRGLADGMKSFNVGDTPLMTPDGSVLFDSFNLAVYSGKDNDAQVAFRFGGESSNQPVGVQLRQGIPVTRTTDSTLRGKINRLEVRLVFNTLYYQDNNGVFEETARFRIAYRPASQPLAWQYYNGQEETHVHGKTTAGYPKDFTIDVPVLANDDWVVQLTKFNAEDNTQSFVDVTWESVQMVTTSGRSYANVALAHIVAKATSQFSSIPTFSGVYDGMLMKIPSNYNPDMRLYDEAGGPWNGSFKEDWTNNPAWILYNLLVNPRWGFARYYPTLTANKFDFYAAAKWCDELVPNGRGGLQPRYTYNEAITDERNALEMLSYIAGAFNAVVYDDASGAVHLRVDRWTEPTMLFTPETVAGGEFQYTFTDIATRYNDLKVSFTNPELDWQTDVRGGIVDPDQIARNGRIPLEFQAVGCTDEHEALRRAWYRLITACTETTTVSFKTARSGLMVDPYDLIYVADPDAGWSTGGRMLSALGDRIYLRDPLYMPVKRNYTMKVQLVDQLVTLTVEPVVAGNVYELRIVSGLLGADVPEYTTFTIEENGSFGYAKPFRVIDIQEVDGDPNQYAIIALEINTNKYNAADNCQPVGTVQYSFKNPRTPPGPVNVQLESGTKYLQMSRDGSLTARIYASWQAPAGVMVDHYEVSYRAAGDQAWQPAPDVYGEAAYISPVQTGAAYDVMVQSVSTLGYRSAGVIVYGHTVVGKSEPPSDVQNFRITRRPTDLLLQWDAVPDLDVFGYELRQGPSWDEGQILTTDLSATAFIHDQSEKGSYPYHIRAIDTSGNYSRNVTTFTLVLEAPAPVDGFFAVPSGNRLEFHWKPNQEPNIAGYEIREGSTWGIGQFIAQVSASGYSIPSGSFGTRMFWIKAIAAPGIYSDIAVFTNNEVAEPTDTNIVYYEDEKASGFSGLRHGMKVFGTSDLSMEDDVSRSEYLFEVSLPESYRARNTVIFNLEARRDLPYTWGDATFTWNALQAQVPWAYEGDLSTLTAEIQMCQQVGLVPTRGDIEGIRLNGDLVPLTTNTSVSVNDKVTYAEGRYGKGARMADFAKAAWTTTLPATFNISFWARPTVIADGLYLRLIGKYGPEELRVRYDTKLLAFILEDSTGSAPLQVPYTLELDKPICIGVVQRSTSRSLFISSMDLKNTGQATINYPPLATFGIIRLY